MTENTAVNINKNLNNYDDVCYTYETNTILHWHQALILTSFNHWISNSNNSRSNVFIYSFITVLHSSYICIQLPEVKNKYDAQKLSDNKLYIILLKGNYSS